jgi:hypothetical protein
METTRKNLFYHMMKQHGLILIDSEIDDIVNILFNEVKVCNCQSLSQHKSNCQLTIGEVKLQHGKYNTDESCH